MKNGYGIALNEWIFDDRIKNELRLLIYISSLTAKNGYCFASNEHLAEKFKTTEVTISRHIQKLIKLDYLDAEYERFGNAIQKRYLRINNMIIADNKNDNGSIQKCKPPVNKNVKYNSTSNNNTNYNNTNTNKSASAKKFTKKEFKKVLLDLDCESELIDDWFKVRDKKKAVYSKTSLKAFINECNKNNYPVASAVQKCAENSWKGFKYEWLNNTKNEKRNSSQSGVQYSDAFKERLLKKLQS